MRIGIDIDDTTVETLESMIKYGKKYSEEVLKQEIKINYGVIKDRYYLKALFGWTDESKYNFFNLYYKKVLEDVKPLPGAQEYITKLKEEGNEITFISSRITSIEGCNPEEISTNTMNKYNIPYDKIIVGAYDKLQYCIDNKIEIFIDDSLEVLQELSNHGIRCYLMNSKVNSELDTEDIPRVFSWEELYNKIKEV